MGGKVLILAGAPTSSSLDWDPSNLLSDLQEPLARFAGLDPAGSPTTPLPSPGGGEQHAVWRSLSLGKERLPSGFSQPHGLRYAGCSFEEDEDDRFFATSFTGAAGEIPSTQELVSQFYEHSLAAHEDIPSSQLISSSAAGQESSVFTDDSSIWVAADPRDAPAAGPATRDSNGNAATRDGNGNLSDLGDIPPAAHLARIQPPTRTVNLVVGIISIAAPRSVRTRWGALRTLVEVLVGDETRAGFAVTFWLPRDDVGGSVLAGLRVQDVVLVRNVALNVFMGKVYGSSLRGGLTRVHLLYRKLLGWDDVGGCYGPSEIISRGAVGPQLRKTRLVWEWVLRFVGSGVGGPAVSGAGVRTWDQPPADTQ